MSYVVHPKELLSIGALSAPARYEYFLAKVADWEEIWSLGNEGGWALCQNDAGETLVPIWPAEGFAAACATGDWASFPPGKISLEDWLEKWTPGMIRDQRSVAMFPTPSNGGVVLDPAKVAEDLREALKQCE